MLFRSSWSRELNCFQAQTLPEAVFPHNTLEIIFGKRAEDGSDGSASLRIRFGALEGLRGWMSLDLAPTLTTHARDSDYWKRIQRLQRLVVANGNGRQGLTGNGDGSVSFSTTDYDYTYTTPYKGGTDYCFTASSTDCSTAEDDDRYRYLRPDSSSFIAKHDTGENDAFPVATAGAVDRRASMGARLRKPICKCKSDGGRAAFLSSSSSARPCDLRCAEYAHTAL